MGVGVTFFGDRRRLRWARSMRHGHGVPASRLYSDSGAPRSLLILMVVVTSAILGAVGAVTYSALSDTVAPQAQGAGAAAASPNLATPAPPIPAGRAFQLMWATDAPPVPVEGQDQVVDIVGNTFRTADDVILGRSCLVDAEGVVSCWGSGSPQSFGVGLYEVPSGEGTRLAEPTPLQVGEDLVGRHVVQVALASTGGCALDDQGQVYCWGERSFTQKVLGQPDSTSGTPALISTRGALTDQVVVEIDGSDSGFCGLSDAGEIICWGVSASPNPDADYLWAEPRKLEGAGYTGLSVGFQEACAVSDQNVLTCWDWISGDVDTASTPVTYNSVGPVAAVAAGAGLCAIDSQGGVKCANAIPDVWPFTGDRSGRPWITVGEARDAANIAVQSEAESEEYFRSGELDLRRDSLGCVTLQSADVRCWPINGYGFTSPPQQTKAGSVAGEADVVADAIGMVAVAGRTVMHVVSEAMPEAANSHDGEVRAQPDTSPPDACAGTDSDCVTIGNKDVNGDGAVDSVALTTDQPCSTTGNCAGLWGLRILTSEGTVMNRSVPITNLYAGDATTPPKGFLTDLTGDGQSEILMLTGGGASSIGLTAYRVDGSDLRAVPAPLCPPGSDGEECGFLVDGVINVTCQDDGVLRTGVADLQGTDSRAGGPSNGLMNATFYRWDEGSWRWVEISSSVVPMATSPFGCPGVDFAS